jgi:hypothetical protein
MYALYPPVVHVQGTYYEFCVAVNNIEAHVKALVPLDTSTGELDWTGGNIQVWLSDGGTISDEQALLADAYLWSIYEQINR